MLPPCMIQIIEVILKDQLTWTNLTLRGMTTTDCSHGLDTLRIDQNTLVAQAKNGKQKQLHGHSIEIKHTD